MIPDHGRVKTIHGITEFGELKIVDMGGVSFMSVGNVFVQVAHISDIRPMREVETNDAWNALLEHVARVFHVLKSDILGKSRNVEYVAARHAAWYCAFTLGMESMSGLGAACGVSQHGTVLYGVKRAKELLTVDEMFSSRIDSIMRAFKQK